MRDSAVHLVPPPTLLFHLPPSTTITPLSTDTPITHNCTTPKARRRTRTVGTRPVRGNAAHLTPPSTLSFHPPSSTTTPLLTKTHAHHLGPYGITGAPPHPHGRYPTCAGQRGAPHTSATTIPARQRVLRYQRKIRTVGTRPVRVSTIPPKNKHEGTPTTCKPKITDVRREAACRPTRTTGTRPVRVSARRPLRRTVSSTTTTSFISKKGTYAPAALNHRAIRHRYHHHHHSPRHLHRDAREHFVPPPPSLHAHAGSPRWVLPHSDRTHYNTPRACAAPNEHTLGAAPPLARALRASSPPHSSNAHSRPAR